MKFNTEKWKKANFRKGIAYRVLQVIMGIAIVTVLYLGGCVAEFPDWTSQQWAMHFLWLGISGGVGLTAWLGAMMIGWVEKGDKT